MPGPITDEPIDLDELVRRVMERDWIERDPTPACFDFNDENMAEMFDLTETAKRHLCECTRCRYIYAVSRRADHAD